MSDQPTITPERHAEYVRALETVKEAARAGAVEEYGQDGDWRHWFKTSSGTMSKYRIRPAPPPSFEEAREAWPFVQDYISCGGPLPKSASAILRRYFEGGGHE